MCDTALRLGQLLQATRLGAVAGPWVNLRSFCRGGLPGGTRTPDLLLRRQLLYPVELRAAIHKEKWPNEWAIFFEGGRSGGIRTRDPLLPKQMRYQAALRSD